MTDEPENGSPDPADAVPEKDSAAPATGVTESVSSAAGSAPAESTEAGTSGSAPAESATAESATAESATAESATTESATTEPATAVTASAPSTAPTPAAVIPHRNRVLIGTLFTLATLLGVFAVLAVWANRQILNTDNWTATSTRILADKDVQTAVAAYSVNQLFSSGAVETEVKSILPTALQPLAGPATAGLEQIAGQAAPRLLASSQIQTAWAEANRAAHALFLKIINGGGKLATTNGGVVTLNLHAIIAQLASSLGIASQVAAVQSKLNANRGTVAAGAAQVGITLPPSTGQLVIMRSNQLKTVQDVASGISGLSIVLPIITFALFALAVYLSRGHRRPALRLTGWCFVGVGVFVLLARRLIGNYVIGALVKNPANVTAANHIWSIATTLLYDIGVAVIAYGLVFVVATWIAGHTRPAMALRRALAPTLRDRPAVAYIVAYGVLLLVILWGPTPATRQLPYIILFIVLVALGVTALIRQTGREFPDAHAGDTMQAIRGMFSDRRHSDGPAAVPVAAGTNGGRVAELERLSYMHDHGSLTDAEFAAEKAVLTNSS
jgi:hypothetical protein